MARNQENTAPAGDTAEAQDDEMVGNDATLDGAGVADDLINAADGQTTATAEVQEPILDAGATAASEEVPTGGEADMVPAQKPEEVSAQVVNPVGEKLGFAEGYERLVPGDLDASRVARPSEDTPAFIYPSAEDRENARREARGE